MRYCIVLACFMVLVNSCKKDDEVQRKFISFKLEGQVILAENPIATFRPANLTDDDPNNDFPTITIKGKGNRDEDLTFTLISETAPFKTGTYLSTQRGNTMSVYYNDSSYALVADDTQGYLSFELNSAKDSLFEARFTGLLADSTGTIAIKPVTDGFVRAILTSN